MKSKRSRLLILLAVVLLIGATVGTAVGKYVTTITVPGKVVFTADLAEEVKLQEHQAKRNADGSYSLTGEIAQPDLNGNHNTYDLLPGLDIPKDPHITISNKTPIEAYLFVEVVESGDVDTENKVITYSMDSGWLKLNGVTGKNNGTVYVYKGEDSSAKVLDENIGTDWTAKILAPLTEGKPETIRVSQMLITTPNTDDDILTFYATMGEVAMGANPTEVYKTIHNIT